eukprot:5239120-Pyramimonas_sp.AAC.1
MNWEKLKADSEQYKGRIRKLKAKLNKIVERSTSFYSSSCANNGKHALKTPVNMENLMLPPNTDTRTPEDITARHHQEFDAPPKH